MSALSSLPIQKSTVLSVLYRRRKRSVPGGQWHYYVQVSTKANRKQITLRNNLFSPFSVLSPDGMNWITTKIKYDLHEWQRQYRHWRKCCLFSNRKKLLPVYVFQGMIMFKTLIKSVMLDCVKTNEVPGTFFSYY